ncbi:MAG: hypothetical protein DHS20C20_26000 [Ardenticatenaceae bacterium]|nr:MAG: hypothetical protein DHS20C20_26000 [Ardenticatenaceae bacterium]
MSRLFISLFGIPKIQGKEVSKTSLDKVKAQELFFFLILHRHKFHTRETLSALLWHEIDSTRAKRYLRKVLWQLQTALKAKDLSSNSTTISKILRIDTNTVGINVQEPFWLDTEILEQAFNLCEGKIGAHLKVHEIELLNAAIEVYQADLLEGWYQDWCVLERERLQRMFLIILDKLIEYCTYQNRFDKGVILGNRVLSYDAAHERTHRHLMRIYYLAGDRTKSIRQFEKCRSIIEKELGVPPSKRTIHLLQKIQNEQFTVDPTKLNSNRKLDQSHNLSETLKSLGELQDDLIILQHKVQQEIQSVRSILAS